MDYKELTRGLSVISKYEKRREYNEINVGNVMEQASTAITALLHRAEAAEAAQETLQRAVYEYKDRAEKAEKERDAYRNMLYKERPCSLCVSYKNTWTSECIRCDSSTKTYRPQFRLREEKEE